MGNLCEPLGVGRSRMDVLGESEVGEEAVLVLLLQVVRMDVAHHPVVGDGVLWVAELHHALGVYLLLAAWGRPTVLLVLVVGLLLNLECSVLPHVTESVSALRLRSLGEARYPLEHVLVVLVDGDPLALPVRAHEVLPDPHGAIVDPPR